MRPVLSVRLGAVFGESPTQDAVSYEAGMGGYEGGTKMPNEQSDTKYLSIYAGYEGGTTMRFPCFCTPRGRKKPNHWPPPNVWGRDGRSDSMDGIALPL